MHSQTKRCSDKKPANDFVYRRCGWREKNITSHIHSLLHGSLIYQPYPSFLFFAISIYFLFANSSGFSAMLKQTINSAQNCHVHLYLECFLNSIHCVLYFLFFQIYRLLGARSLLVLIQGCLIFVMVIAPRHAWRLFSTNPFDLYEEKTTTNRQLFYNLFSQLSVVCAPFPFTPPSQLFAHIYVCFYF